LPTAYTGNVVGETNGTYNGKVCFGDHDSLDINNLNNCAHSNQKV